MTIPPIDLDFPHAADLEALWHWTRRQAWGDRQLAMAMKDFLAQSGPILNPAAQNQQDLRFIDWYHFDRLVPEYAATPVTLWLAGRDGPLAHTVIGGYKVKRTVPHRQAVLEGLWDGAGYRVTDKALSVGVQRGQLVFGRLYSVGDNWVPGASLMAVESDVALALAPLEELAGIRDGLALERVIFQQTR